MEGVLHVADGKSHGRSLRFFFIFTATTEIYSIWLVGLFFFFFFYSTGRARASSPYPWITFDRAQDVAEPPAFILELL